MTTAVTSWLTNPHWCRVIGHRWTNWRVEARIQLFDSGAPNRPCGDAIRQVRTCLRCHRTDLDTQKVIYR